MPDSLQIRHNIRMQKIVAMVAVLLFGIKIFAWHLTHSVAIYTDALESVANIFSGFFGLYSLNFSAQPRDRKHPYGHGKIEFIAAAMEGTFIVLAGGAIIFRVANSFGHEQVLAKLDTGIVLIVTTAIINYAVGYASIRIGMRNKSLPLIAGGRHLQTDTWSTIGIIVGLVLVYLTRIAWLDSVTAVIFATLIMAAGIKILRQALGGIMDEADPELIAEIVALINTNRRPNWVDLHNLRIIKYGAVLHIDAHMTVPGSLTVQQGHDEQEILAEIIRQKYGSRVELFVHLDPCPDDEVSNGEDWTMENVLQNRQHRFRQVS